MPDNSNLYSNSQTVVVDADLFAYETVEQTNGQATVVRFQIENPNIKPGDVLLVLSGADIHFHGLIGKIEEGWALAADRRGSMLPAGVH